MTNSLTYANFVRPSCDDVKPLEGYVVTFMLDNGIVVSGVEVQLVARHSLGYRLSDDHDRMLSSVDICGVANLYVHGHASNNDQDHPLDRPIIHCGPWARGEARS